MKSYIQKLSTKQIVIAVYLLLLLGGYLYIQRTLKEESKIQLSTRVEEPGQNIKEFNVDVVIKGKDTVRFRERVFNNDSILDLLEQLYKNDKITFERVAYSYGMEIEHINKEYMSDTQSWNVYMTLDNKNVSDSIKNLRLNETEGNILKAAIDKKTDVSFQIADVTLVENGLYEIELTRN